MFRPQRCSLLVGCSTFLLCVLSDEAAGKMTREEGKHDLGAAPEDCFPDNLSIPPATAELVANPLSSRSGRRPCLSCGKMSEWGRITDITRDVTESKLLYRMFHVTWWGEVGCVVA